jgi:lipopolysaccharide export system permease protein
LWIAIFFELGKLVLLAASVLVGIIAMGAAIKPLADGVLDAGDALTFISLAMVPMLAYVLPFASGFAATLTYHRLATSNEAIAAHAGGIGHRSLLMPALAMGVVLMLTVSFLNEQVIPRFLGQMQQLITVDVARLLAQRIERGRALALGDGAEKTMIFADQAERVKPVDGSGVIDQVVFTNFAAIQLDASANPIREVTASRATMWLLPPGTQPYASSLPTHAGDNAGGGGGGENAIVVVEMRDVIAAEPAGLGGFRGASQLVFAVPNFFRDNPKFLTFGELRALKHAPERINWIAARKRSVAHELAAMQGVRDISAGLAASREVTFFDERSARVTLRAAGLTRMPDGRVRIEPTGGAGAVQAVLVEHSRKGELGDVALESQTREAWLVEAGVVRVAPGHSGGGNGTPGHGANPVATPTYKLELHEVRTRDVMGQTNFDLAPERTVTILAPLVLAPPPAPLAAGSVQGAGGGTPDLTLLATPELLRIANAAALQPDAPQRLRSAIEDLGRKTFALQREVLSKQHERMAMAVSCLVIVLVGAITALRLSQRLPLTTYVWTFLPGMVSIVTISGGQQLIEDSGTPGLVLMWGGVLALALYALVQYRMLARH